MNNKEFDFYLNLANTFAVAMFGVIATLFTEIRGGKNDFEYLIIEIVIIVLLAIFVVTSYIYAYLLAKDE